MCNYSNKQGRKRNRKSTRIFRAFGFEAPKEIYYDSVNMDCCLCQVDVEKALTEHKIPFKKYCGDIYVGDLDNVIGDDD